MQRRAVTFIAFVNRTYHLGRLSSCIAVRFFHMFLHDWIKKFRFLLCDNDGTGSQVNFNEKKTTTKIDRFVRSSKSLAWSRVNSLTFHFPPDSILYILFWSFFFFHVPRVSLEDLLSPCPEDFYRFVLEAHEGFLPLGATATATTMTMRTRRTIPDSPGLVVVSSRTWGAPAPPPSIRHVADDD